MSHNQQKPLTHEIDFAALNLALFIHRFEKYCKSLSLQVYEFEEFFYDLDESFVQTDVYVGPRVHKVVLMHAHARQNPPRVYNVTLADPHTHGMISICAYCDQPGHDHEECAVTCKNEDCLASANIKNPHAHKDCPFLDYYDEEGNYEK